MLGEDGALRAVALARLDRNRVGRPIDDLHQRVADDDVAALLDCGAVRRGTDPQPLTLLRPRGLCRTGLW